MADNPSNTAALEQMVDEVARKLESLRQTQSAAKTQMIIAVLMMVVIMLIFGYKTYQTVRTNFATDLFKAELETRVGPLTYLAQEKATAALLDAWPTYRELAVTRFHAILPDVRKNAEKELTALPDKIQERLVKDLDASVKRVGGRIEADLKKDYPFLNTSNDEQIKKILDNFHLALQDEAENFKKNAESRVQEELHRFHDALSRFEVRPTSDKELGDLEKQLIRDFIQYVDYEVSVVNTPEGIDLTTKVAPSE